MSLPIPYHLRGIAEEIKCTKETLLLQLRCQCGCERFCMFENTLTAEEQAQLAPYNAAMDAIYTGGGSHYCTQDADGTVHYWKKRLLHKPVEYTPPKPPPFAGLNLVKIRCAECAAETVLFDSRYHGYDGAVCGSEVPADYQPQMKQKFTKNLPARRIRVQLECTVTAAELAEITDGAPFAESLFSECFTEIVASAEDANGKYREFFSAETA